MKPERNKQEREMQVFQEFIRQSGFALDGEAENRPPPEPDILCKHGKHGFIAFELVELCDSQIAQKSAKITRSENTKAVFMWTTDPTDVVISKKLLKSYKTNHPIELLCYTDGRLITPYDVIIATIRDLIETQGFGMFQRVWLLGEKSCQVISERSL